MALGSEPIGNSSWLEGLVTFLKVLVVRKSYSGNNERQKTPQNKKTPNLPPNPKPLSNLAGMRLIMSSVLNLRAMERH